ncbi:MAG: thioester domain-containing protein, partial [Bacilli bacterium]
MKNIRIILSILAIIVVGLCLTNVKAIAINDNYFVWQRNDVDQTSRLKKTSTNGDIITSFVGYTENNSFQPAYCNNAQKDGVGGVHNHPGYTVNVTGLADAAAWRVISNGYPYKTPAELGVDNEYDAFTATKHAVYVVIGQSPVRVYAGKDERGRKVVNAIRNLSSKAVGANGLSNYTAPNFIINESNITEEGDYIVKTIRGTSNTINAEAINVSLNNAPSGTVISDLNGNIKTVFNDNEVIKISVFKKSINIKTSFQINIDAKFASYKVYFGKALSSNLQDYYMTSEKYEYAKATSNFVYELPKKTCDDV